MTFLSMTGLAQPSRATDLFGQQSGAAGAVPAARSKCAEDVPLQQTRTARYLPWSHQPPTCGGGQGGSTNPVPTHALTAFPQRKQPLETKTDKQIHCEEPKDTLVLRAPGRASTGSGVGGKLPSLGLTSANTALHWPRPSAQRWSYNCSH